MKNIRDSGYTIFIPLPKPFHGKIKHGIEILAKEFSALVFEPHITLISMPHASLEDACTTFKKITAKLTPFSITFDEIDTKHTYFRALYIKIKESSSLQNLRKNAIEICGDDESNFIPHVSLLYGNLGENAYKKTKIKTEELLLNEIMEQTFIVERLELWKTEGYANEWVKVFTK